MAEFATGIGVAVVITLLAAAAVLLLVGGMVGGPIGKTLFKLSLMKHVFSGGGNSNITDTALGSLAVLLFVFIALLAATAISPVITVLVLLGGVGAVELRKRV